MTYMVLKRTDRTSHRKVGENLMFSGRETGEELGRCLGLTLMRKKGWIKM